MIRALCLTALTILAVPASATEGNKAPAADSGTTVLAQEGQRPPQQQAPKRDCERRQEGVS